MTTIFKAAFFIALVLLEVIRAPHRARNRRDRHSGQVTASQVQGSETLLLTISFFTLYVLPLVYIFSDWLSFADYSLPDWFGFVGITLALVAVWVIWRAHADLGKSWSPSLEVTQEQKLITNGIYQHLRHPIYTAMWLFMIAQALLLHNWLAGPVGLVTFLPIYFLRVPREEQMMIDQFGDEYRAYMREVGRFLPRF
jgi:protein-S-isoprenylcysteine O-methyltransferase Ste14